MKFSSALVSVLVSEYIWMVDSESAQDILHVTKCPQVTRVSMKIPPSSDHMALVETCGGLIIETSFQSLIHS